MAPERATSHPTSGPDADWLTPPEESFGLNRYLQTLRERVWIVLAAVVITTGAAVLYVLTASKTYTAEANVLVSPVSATNTPLVGLPGLIPASTDPTRDVETAAQLITNAEVARRVKVALGSSESTGALLGKASATPVSSSNIVAVTANASTPIAARDLANAFATEAVAEQSAKLHAAIDKELPQLEVQLQGSGDPTAIRTAIAALEIAAPSLAVETRAQTPTSPSSPRTKLSIASGLLAGLVLGLGAAFASQNLDPRLRREEQLRRLYRLPILARIPKESRVGDDPLSPLDLSPATLEAYRTLRGTLAAKRRLHGPASRAILVTGCSPSEGKTTTAINLASSLATAENKVILVEADLRRPSIGRALGVRPEYGITSVLVEGIPLQDAIVNGPDLTSNLGMLLADYEGGWISELFALPGAREMLIQAREMADYVIIDSPPLADVIDALPLAQTVDDVLVVVGIGKTRIKKLAQLGELLAENGIKPAGFAVVGTAQPGRSEYHYYHAQRPATREKEAPEPLSRS